MKKFKTQGIPKMSDVITDMETIPLDELVIGFYGSIHQYNPFLCKRVNLDDDDEDLQGVWVDECGIAIDGPKYAFMVLDSEG